MRGLCASSAFVALVALVTSPAAGGAGLQAFQSPSGNIGCYLSAAGARCDIRERDWRAPVAPRSCRLDYGQGLQVQRRSLRGSFVCAGDTALGSGAKLAYGRSIARGGIRCTSRTSGITCRNARGRGFRISRQSYRRF